MMFIYDFNASVFCNIGAPIWSSDKGPEKDLKRSVTAKVLGYF